MRTTTFAMAGVVAALAAGPALAGFGDPLEFNFTLTGDQEVPPNDSDAVGAGQLLYDPGTMTFDLDIMVFGIGLGDLLGVGPNETPIHIHFAPPGSNGPIVIDLGLFDEFEDDGLGIRYFAQDIGIGGLEGDEFSADELQDALFGGELYVNIHTETFPAGEIRGQIPAIPTPGAVALLGAGLLVGVRPGRRSRS